MKMPFHIMAKPIGPVCNLACKYCFYLEKQHLFPDNEKYRMTDETLEIFIKNNIETNPAQEINFAWQGGEPTLMGIDFFKKAVELQKQYSDGRKISNAFQTNGIVFDDEWCEFLAENHFLVGISIDGPPEINDAFRVDREGKPTTEIVLRSIEKMKKAGVTFNSLSCVNRLSGSKPLEVYNFLKSIGVDFMQFIPIVERLPDEEAEKLGIDLAPPPELDEEPEASEVTKWSVQPRQYGNFLNSIFDEWVKKDVGKIFVQIFDVALSAWVGYPPSLCSFAPKCGNALILEHNGDVYACDHFMYPKYKRGNILEQSLEEIVFSPEQIKFGNDKLDALPEFCLKCNVRFVCNGGCPKQRFLMTKQGDAGLNYLCAGYKKFFKHIDPDMQTMANLIRMGRPAADIMETELNSRFG
ncbi:anaerobic sulfatase maturase [bacterium]|nr:anaerobic sulfatase maturase [bacterium]